MIARNKIDIKKFALFTLLFKYLTENIIYDFVSFAIDLVLYLWETKTS